MILDRRPVSEYLPPWDPSSPRYDAGLLAHTSLAPGCCPVLVELAGKIVGRCVFPIGHARSGPAECSATWGERAR